MRRRAGALNELECLLPLLGGGEQMASANPETRRVTLLTETSRGCPGIQDDFIEGKATPTTA